MQIRQYPGSNPAHVPNIATEPPRFPHDEEDPPTFECFTLDQFVWSDEEPALTIEGHRRRQILDTLPPTSAPSLVDDWVAPDDDTPHDSFTVDAEILVDRSGLQENFTVNEVAALLNTQSSRVHKWIAAGKIPAARQHGEVTDDLGRLILHWKRPQVIEIVARRLRAEHYAW